MISTPTYKAEVCEKVLGAPETVMGIYQNKATPFGVALYGEPLSGPCYFASSEQCPATNFHAPSFTHVSVHIIVRARCSP